jgi:hypothetical protein
MNQSNVGGTDHRRTLSGSVRAVGDSRPDLIGSMLFEWTW